MSEPFTRDFLTLDQFATRLARLASDIKPNEPLLGRVALIAARKLSELTGIPEEDTLADIINGDPDPEGLKADIRKERGGH